nr:hypothetical protein [Bdellovibrionales bacterium]
MLKAILISFIFIAQAWAQDEDLTFLESSINSDPTAETEASQSTSTTTTTTTIKRSRWSVTRPEAGTVQEKDKQGRVLDLRSVIEEGFRRNPFEKIRGQQREQIELLKTDVFQKFWFPTIGLELQSSNHRIDRFHQSSQSTPEM